MLSDRFAELPEPLLDGRTVTTRGQPRHVFKATLEKYSAAFGLKSGVDYYFCPQTEVVFQHPIIDETEYKRMYEVLQRSDEVGYCSTDVPTEHVRHKEGHTAFKLKQLELLGMGNLLPGRRVLEIGPAEGTLLRHLRDRGYQVRGIEPLELYARYARKVNQLDVKTGYFSEETLEERAADLIILDNVLEHTLRPFDTLCLRNAQFATMGSFTLRCHVRKCRMCLRRI